LARQETTKGKEGLPNQMGRRSQEEDLDVDRAINGMRMGGEGGEK
jgi:hypothetical protein